MHRLNIVFTLSICCVFFSSRVCAHGAGALTYRSAYLQVQFAQDQPALAALAVDSLGKGMLDVNVLLDPGKPSSEFGVRRTGRTVRYWQKGEAMSNPPAWIFATSAAQIRLILISNCPTRPFWDE